MLSLQQLDPIHVADERKVQGPCGSVGNQTAFREQQQPVAEADRQRKIV
jgi:hypothetical protein